MTITANFSGGDRVVTTAPLYQWDTGQKLALSGLPQTASDIQVHFANAAMPQAIVKATELVDNLPTCDVPNVFLQFGSAAKARAWVYYKEGSSKGYTIKTVLIPITPRKRPNDYVSPEDPDSKGIVDRAIELLEGYEDDLASKLSAAPGAVDTENLADESVTVEKVANDFAAVINAKEVKSNKKTTLTGNESSNDFYPTTKAVADALNTKADSSALTAKADVTYVDNRAEEVGDLKSAIDDMNTVSTNAIPKYNGNLSNNKTWNQTSSGAYKFFVVPVNPGDLVVTSFANVIQIGFLKSFSVPTSDGGAIPYSDVTGFTDRIDVGPSERKYYVPNDSYFLVVENYKNNSLTAVNKLSVNGYDYAKSLIKNIDKIIEKANALPDILQTEENFSVRPYNVGHMSIESTTWVQITTTNLPWRHKVFSVNPNDIVELSFSAAITIGFVKTYTEPTADGQTVNYSSESGYTASIEVGVKPKSFKVPSDCHYLIVENYRNGTEYACNKFTINGYDYAKPFVDNFGSIVYAVSGEELAVKWESGAINSGTGEDVSSSTRVRCGSITISKGIKVHVPSEMKLMVITYLSDESVISSAWQTNDFIYYPRVEKENTVRMFGGYTNNATISDANIGARFTMRYIPVQDDAPVCFGLGDSIMQGFYSYTSGGSDQIAVTENCWVNRAMAYKKHKFVNMGVGGSGYVHAGTVLDRKNAKDHVDSIDFSDADYVLMAWGVNDWKYNENLGSMSSTSGDGTIYGNMKYVVEKILNDNPLCKIFVVTPLNSANTTKNYGTKATNWGLGYELSNSGTLEDVFQAEKDIAEYYGLQLIDQTHTSIVNRENLLSVLIDGVHPSLDCHGLIGREMSGKITF